MRAAGKDGKVPPAVLIAADICGVTKIFKVGGEPQAMRLWLTARNLFQNFKIFGPEKPVCHTAKMLVYGEVAIDMPAGPSEVFGICR